MSPARAAVVRLERGTLRALNRAAGRPAVRRVFETASRLGDGWAWGALLLALPVVDPARGPRGSLRMLATGVACTLLYRLVKRWTRRPRPLHVLEDLRASVAPLDEFSFPSGHTMHAVAFALLAAAEVPLLGWVLFPFASLVAASRLVLALHYPSDVLAGAMLGAGMAQAALALAPV